MLEVKRKPASHSQGHSDNQSHGTSPSSRAPGYPDRPADTQPPDHGHKPNGSQSQPSTHSLAIAEPKSFQSRLPAITGEVHFRGMLTVDGLLSGQLGSASCMSVKQRSRMLFASEPELSGEFSFKDMIRVNGHIAGTVGSKNGTLIVDTEAIVEADVNVAVAVMSGTVKGEIVARDRVELGPTAKIYGNIWTRSIVIKNGAIFEGVCRMIEEEQAS